MKKQLFCIYDVKHTPFINYLLTTAYDKSGAEGKKEQKDCQTLERTRRWRSLVFCWVVVIL